MQGLRALRILRRGVVPVYDLGSEIRVRGDESPLRLAVVGSPRSGNTWIRTMLGSFYDLEQFSIHNPDELDWSSLPGRCVIQIHRYPLPEFLELLDDANVRVVMPVRHPFDVLMSWLNYNYHVHEDGKCNGGCDECPIVGVSPGSRTFLEYASGYHGRSLLCYGPAWLMHARSYVHPLCYEELVANPAPALAALADWLGEPLRRPVAEVIEETSIRRLQKDRGVWQYHYWQGEPGLWKKLLTAENARRIADAVPEAFEWLDYECDPDEALTAIEADRNWLRLQLDSFREHLSLEKRKHREALKDLSSLRHRLAG